MLICISYFFYNGVEFGLHYLLLHIFLMVLFFYKRGQKRGYQSFEAAPNSINFVLKPVTVI